MKIKSIWSIDRNPLLNRNKKAAGNIYNRGKLHHNPLGNAEFNLPSEILMLIPDPIDISKAYYFLTQPNVSAVRMLHD